MLKGGLVYADAITTVSNTYAEEIKTEFYGEHLDGLLRARAHDLRGIVNGIDYEEYNPETDTFLAKNYNAKNFRKEKVKNKLALQKELGLSRKKHTTDDMLFTVETVSCLGACGLAPTMTVNNEVHPSMTPEKALELIAELRGDNV